MSSTLVKYNRQGKQEQTQRDTCTHEYNLQPPDSAALVIARRRPLRCALDDGRPVPKPCFEEDVGVREQAFLERDDDELRAYRGMSVCASDVSEKECVPLNRVRNSCPMCCVCCRSRAASISSRMYIGAGLNCSNAIIRDSAISDLQRAS